MPGTLQPLDPQFAIADLQGRPTLYFIKWAQQKQIDITGSAQLDGGNDFIGDQNIDGNLTVTDGGVTLKANPTSPGFTVADRAVVPGHQINFISNAPITGGGAVLNVFAAKSSAAAKNISQISLFTVPPDAVSTVQSAIRASTGASGEEMILLTQQFGAAGLIAGDIVFEPNTVEKLRILSAAGDPAVKVTGQLSVTDDPYSASWDGSTDVPTKNAVYDKIQSLVGGGSGTYLSIPNFRPNNGTTVGAGNFACRGILFTQDCTIYDVGFYATVASATTKITPGIYAIGAGGIIGNLLASGAQVTGVTAGVNNAPLTTPLVVTAGTYLWVGFQALVAAPTLGTIAASPETAFFASTGALPSPAPAATYGTLVAASIFPRIAP